MVRAVLWQRVEGAILFVVGLALALHGNDGIPWWSALLIFFVPDLSFAAYLLGPRVGAFCYNAVHIYAFGAALLAIGLIVPMPLLAALGGLWLSHSGFDRMLGYGLKSPEGFAVTHLGLLGKASLARDAVT
jgi:hypothetical protein